MNKTLPAPLDNSVLHTPAEYRQWQEDCAAFHAEQRAIEQKAAQLKAQQEANASRLMTNEEYHALAVERANEQHKRAVERQLIVDVKKQEKLDYLKSSPEIASLNESNPYTLIETLLHWGRRNYQLTENSIQYFADGIYQINLVAPKAKTVKAS